MVNGNGQKASVTTKNMGPVYFCYFPKDRKILRGAT